MTYYLQEAWRSVRLHPVTNLVSTAGIALALFTAALLMGIFWNVEHLLRLVRAEAGITVYLKDELTAQEIGAISARLMAEPHVESVHHVTRSEALERMLVLLGDEERFLTAFEGENPFAGFLEVTVPPEEAGRVARFARTLSGVEAVRDNEDILARLTSLAAVTRWAGTVVAGAVGLMAVVVTSHMVRLGMYARREDIETVRLLGATEGFVAAPFLLEGTLLGTMGGLAAGLGSALLFPQLYELCERSLPFLPLLPWPDLVTRLALLTLGLGLGFGLLGSLLSVRAARR